MRHGVELLTGRGSAAVGLDELLRGAGVPKGSFYHYFANKEAFVAASVDAYAEYFARKVRHHLHDLPGTDDRRTADERIAAFVADACEGVRRHDFTRGCLVGTVGQESQTLSEPLRARLEQVLREWELLVAECLRAGVARGELRADLDCDALAHAFWTGWEGAVLRARLARSTGPMTAFHALFRAALR